MSIDTSSKKQYLSPIYITNNYIYNYLKNDDEENIIKAATIAFDNNLSNLACLLIYKTLYEKPAEECLLNVDPKMFIIYGKCLEKIKNLTQ